MGNVPKRKIDSIDNIFNYKMDKIKNIFVSKNININHHKLLNPLNLFEIRLNKSQNNCFTYEMKKEIIADWYLDYLIGFYSKYTIEIEIYINDIFICKQKLYGNSYTNLNCNPVPLHFLLQNHKILNFTIFILCDNLIFDKMQDDDLKFFVFCSCYEILGRTRESNGFKTVFFCSKDQKLKQILYDKKVALKINNDYIEKSDFLEIPMINDYTEEYRQYLAKKTCDIIKYDLLSVSMNPNRIEYFLTNDEKKKYNIKLS
jgi:hypothetical protein